MSSTSSRSTTGELNVNCFTSTLLNQNLATTAKGDHIISNTPDLVRPGVTSGIIITAVLASTYCYYI